MEVNPVLETVQVELVNDQPKKIEKSNNNRGEKEKNKKEKRIEEENQSRTSKGRENQSIRNENYRDNRPLKKKEEMGNQSIRQMRAIHAKKGKSIMGKYNKAFNAPPSMQNPPMRPQSWEEESKVRKDNEGISRNIWKRQERKESRGAEDETNISITDIILNVKEQLKMERYMARKECENKMGNNNDTMKSNEDRNNKNKNNEHEVEIIDINEKEVNRKITEEERNENKEKAEVNDKKGDSGNAMETNEEKVRDDKEKEVIEEVKDDDEEIKPDNEESVGKVMKENDKVKNEAVKKRKGKETELKEEKK